MAPNTFIVSVATQPCQPGPRSLHVSGTRKRTARGTCARSAGSREEPDVPGHVLRRFPALMALRFNRTGAITVSTEEARRTEYVAAMGGGAFRWLVGREASQRCRKEFTTTTTSVAPQTGPPLPSRRSRRFAGGGGTGTSAAPTVPARRRGRQPESRVPLSADTRGADRRECGRVRFRAPLD